MSTTQNPKPAVIPQVQLPVGVVPQPQSGTSEDALKVIC